MHALRIHDGNIYLDGTRIEGVKKYSLDWEQDELPVLKMEILLKPVLNPELGRRVRVDKRGNAVAVYERPASEIELERNVNDRRKQNPRTNGREVHVKQTG